jgi:hypothetical protein
MAVKPFWASKTLWANGIALVGSVGISLGFDMGFTPEVQGTLVAGVMAVVNIILRFMTKDAVR